MTSPRSDGIRPRRERQALALSIVAFMLGFGVLLGRAGSGQLGAEGPSPMQATEVLTPLPTMIFTMLPPTIPPGSVTPLPTNTPKLPTPTPDADTPTPTVEPATATPPPASPTPTGPTPTGPTPTPVDTPTPPPTTVGPTDTPGPSATSTNTASPVPTSTPRFTPTATPCADNWTIAVWAYVDTVGKGPYSCPGCDGNFRDGDRYQASYCPLAPLRVIITPRDDPTIALVDTFIEREHPGRKDISGQDIRILFSLCAPPPYRIQMITEFPPCYSLCPNTPPTRIITQRDFDISSGRGERGAGRYIQEKFGYWRCGRDTVPTPVAVDSCAIHPDEGVRTYPDGRTSIGNNGGFEAIGTRPGSALWWRDAINAVRVPGNLPIAYPANGTLGIMQLAPQGPLGTSGIASISNDVRMPAVSPPTSDLGLDVHWRVVRGDPATAGFTLSGTFGGTTFDIASSDPASGLFVPSGTWQARSVPVTPILRDGLQTIKFDVSADVGVEVYIDNVDLDFCYQEPTPTPTNTPVPPSPTPTSTPTNTPTNTPVPPSPTPTNTPSPTPTRTNTPTVGASPTPTNTPTNTPVPPSPTPSHTPSPTNTPGASPTPSNTPTNTPVPPSPTPTNTPVPPSPTPTNTPVPPPSPTPTDTPATPPTATPTNTPVPPSPTPSPTNTPIDPPPSATPTNTPVPPPSSTPTPTNTPIVPPPSATPTNTPVPPSPTPTDTPVPPSPTPTFTRTPTNTPGPSPTPTNTRPPGTPPTPRPPEDRPPGGCPDGPHSCLRVVKYHDRNSNGRRDRGEPLLPGMPFEIIEDRTDPRHHRRDTDPQGEFVICFDRPVRVIVRELTRELGGTWVLTTQLPDHVDLRCDETITLEVGNAPLTRMPETGRAADGTPEHQRLRRSVHLSGTAL